LSWSWAGVSSSPNLWIRKREAVILKLGGLSSSPNLWIRKKEAIVLELGGGELFS
jgi:hypothetical protein